MYETKVDLKEAIVNDEFLNVDRPYLKLMATSSVYEGFELTIK